MRDQSEAPPVRSTKICTEIAYPACMLVAETNRPMRRSKEVQLTVLASVALTITGCNEPRNCVDANSRLLPPSACQTSSPATGAHWIYGGSSGGHIGDTVVGGSISRGGFGGIGGLGDAGGE